METLRVGAAFPDPPFNGMPDNSGLDIDLMTEIAKGLGATVEFIEYGGADFNGIFDALNAGEYDCVAAGTTVTSEREKKAQFVPPYLISGQSLAVDTTRLPKVTSINDLDGLTIGVQQGNTSQPIAERLVAEGKAGAVRVYDYATIRSALTDLTTGECDAFMKLATGAHRTGQADTRCRGGAARDLGREHRDRGTTGKPGAVRTSDRRPGRAGAGRNVATDTTKMAGQSIRRPEPGRALSQPARGVCHTTRLAVEEKGKKGRNK